jgi:predicted kinase
MTPHPDIDAPDGPLLRVLIGSPASGKTTLCATERAAGRFGTRLSLDDTRAVLGKHAHDQCATPAAVAYVSELAGALLAAGGEVTIDTTATTAQQRAGWLALARIHGAPTVAVLVRTPLDVALARNARRARPVPADVLTEFWRRVAVLEPRDLLTEGFRAVDIVDTTPRPTTSRAPAARQGRDKTQEGPCS